MNAPISLPWISQATKAIELPPLPQAEPRPLNAARPPHLGPAAEEVHLPPIRGVSPSGQGQFPLPPINQVQPLTFVNGYTMSNTSTLVGSAAPQAKYPSLPQRWNIELLPWRMANLPTREQ